MLPSDTIKYIGVLAGVDSFEPCHLTGDEKNQVGLACGVPRLTCALFCFA